MDAKEKLRRYLEQRRDMGERELILDGMSVEDVMRILGAGTSGGGAGAVATTRSADPAAAAPRAAPAPHAAPSETEPSDWREILRGTGSAPAKATSIARPDTPADTASPPPPPPPAPPQATNRPQPDGPPPPPSPDEFDDADAPEDALVTVPPPRASKPAPVAKPLVERPAQPVGEPAPGIVVGTSSRELFGGPMTGFTTLDQLAEEIAKCTKCPLYRTATKPVPGQGSPTAELVCVGEAPGENEDKSGLAFVGMAGQLLTKILAAINLSREDVFICNVLKHRPPGNRNPNPQEVEACSPYLVRQLEIIRPKVIVAFGTFAAQTLLETKLSIGKLRGQVHRYYGTPLVVTYHPAALLRNPAWKRPTWEDVQLARRVLDRAAGA
jgi:DNA polymerase